MANMQDQLDWPFEAGMMHDKSLNFGRNAMDKQCNVLDRLPLFQYRYRPAGRVRVPEDKRNTLSEGGSCHMGRGASMNSREAPKFSTNLCRKIHTNYTHVVVRCGGAQNTFTDYELKKEKSAAPNWMVENMRTQKKRQMCGACSPPPKWKTESGNSDLPHGPEVSYGIPFRWSASRLLAADVRSMVCGSRHNSSKECDDLMNFNNSSSSSKEQFADAFFGSGSFAEKWLSANASAGTQSIPNIKDAMLNFSQNLASSLD